ncbi:MULTISPECIES: TetR/AcrR family transcriptional regulator [unclassified Vibrio]|uniref:TetR/AcrR family transcriptional regulator n=1 Tax=Vibrio sp. HB236076 TaxID=3232307 RepID=A0AB39HLG1_9VIBR|nr:TetR/AcrR family transcriptional regulator [Vibrio sp. HB161653]MDP5252659.1 TetR/AcrR family transcriptional regulator [Vibrio sp. HB161653]
MPKRSKQETNETINTIKSAVFDQLLTLGYEEMSYTSLSQQTGISRTGICHHFPKKIHFTEGVEAILMERLLSHLDSQSGVEAFERSWMSALKVREFTIILQTVFYHLFAKQGSKCFAAKCIDYLLVQIKARLSLQSDQRINALLGQSIIDLCR